MTRKIICQTKLLLILVLLTLIGFIQWETWFPLEIKNKTLQKIADGGLSFGALFLLVCFGFGKLVQRTKGFMQGITFLLFPLLILLTAFIWFASSILPSPKWKDIGVYKNDNDYIVLQRMDYPAVTDRDDWRIIRITSAVGVVRWLKGSYPFKMDENTYARKQRELDFAGKKWQRTATEDDQ